MLDKITTTTINNVIQIDLRDLFAAFAMQPLLAEYENPDEAQIATAAYIQADAMLAARKQTDTTQGTP
jgi:hypothetical protein